MQRNRGKQQNGKDQRSLQENWRYERNNHAWMDVNKERNDMDLTEAEQINRWQEHKETVQKRS